MTSVTANRAKQNFGQVLDSAQREPVLIQKHNRPAAVLLSTQEYDRLRGLNRSEFMDFCQSVGDRAKKAGLTEDSLTNMLSEK
jgi:prevent-host-death family protein